MSKLLLRLNDSTDRGLLLDRLEISLRSRCEIRLIFATHRSCLRDSLLVLLRFFSTGASLESMGRRGHQRALRLSVTVILSEAWTIGPLSHICETSKLLTEAQLARCSCLGLLDTLHAASRSTHVDRVG